MFNRVPESLNVLLIIIILSSCFNLLLYILSDGKPHELLDIK